MNLPDDKLSVAQAKALRDLMDDAKNVRSLHIGTRRVLERRGLIRILKNGTAKVTASGKKLAA